MRNDVSESERLARVIRAELIRRGLDQTAIAAAIGRSTASVSRRMVGVTDWTYSELRAVAELLDVDLRDLVGDRPEKATA